MLKDAGWVGGSARSPTRKECGTGAAGGFGQGLLPVLGWPVPAGPHPQLQRTCAAVRHCGLPLFRRYSNTCSACTGLAGHHRAPRTAHRTTGSRGSSWRGGQARARLCPAIAGPPIHWAGCQADPASFDACMPKADTAPAVRLLLQPTTNCGHRTAWDAIPAEVRCLHATGAAACLPAWLHAHLVGRAPLVFGPLDAVLNDGLHIHACKHARVCVPARRHAGCAGDASCGTHACPAFAKLHMHMQSLAAQRERQMHCPPVSMATPWSSPCDRHLCARARGAAAAQLPSLPPPFDLVLSLATTHVYDLQLLRVCGQFSQLLQHCSGRSPACRHRAALVAGLVPRMRADGTAQNSSPRLKDEVGPPAVPCLTTPHPWSPPGPCAQPP